MKSVKNDLLTGNLLHLYDVTEDPIVKEQIEAESRLLQKLNHPHIVKCIETFESEESIDIILEL